MQCTDFKYRNRKKPIQQIYAVALNVSDKETVIYLFLFNKMAKYLIDRGRTRTCPDPKSGALSVGPHDLRSMEKVAQFIRWKGEIIIVNWLYKTYWKRHCLNPQEVLSPQLLGERGYSQGKRMFINSDGFHPTRPTRTRNSGTDRNEPVSQSFSEYIQNKYIHSYTINK